MQTNELLVKELLNNQLQELRALFGEEFYDFEKCLSSLDREVLAFATCLDGINFPKAVVSRKGLEHYQFIWTNNQFKMSVNLQELTAKIVQYTFDVQYASIPIWNEQFSSDTMKILGLLFLFKDYVRKINE